jgi:hypothetical protein
MPTLKPCPHCGLLIEDWHREWYSKENQRLPHNHLAAADFPNPECHGGVDLYAKVDGVFSADPKLPILRRSKTQAKTWAGGDAGFAAYIQSDPTGMLYANYRFEA